MAAYSEQQCSKWLKENCLVNVRKEWLDECFQFLKQEHAGGFSSKTQLNNLVYEQLLMADFQEMSLGTLPSLGTGNIVSTLQGKHILQINSLMDVGQSAYSQIQKLKGQDDLENQKENTNNNNNWEPKIKPSRMLFLQMTDGSKNIQAMEYQPIPCLNKSTAPGTKVQIQGPVSCRQGVLLLTSKNVQTLGGSVEELEETNSMWKVLHNAIGQDPPEMPTGSSYIKDETETRDDVESLLNTNDNNIQGHGQLGSNTNTRQQPYTSNDRYVPTFTDNKKRSSNSVQQGKTGQAARGRRSSDSNKRPLLSCSNKETRNNNNSDIEDVIMLNDGDLFDDHCNEIFDFDQLDQMEQEVIDNAFDDNIDEMLDLDQIDQIEKEVIQNSNPTCNRIPDQKVNSPHIDNEIFDEDFMEDDFDLEDFDMEQWRIALPKTDSGYKNSRETAETEKKCMPMAKKLKTAMGRTETNKITSTGCGSTETSANNTESKGRSFMNYENVGTSKSELTTQSNKSTGKLGLKKLKNSLQSTITFGKQPLSSGIKKEEGTGKIVGLVAPANRKSPPFFKVKTEAKSNDMTTDVDNSAFANTTGSGSTSSTYNEMRNTQEKKPTRKLGLKNAIEFNTQQSSMNPFLEERGTKKESRAELIDLDEEDEKEAPLVEGSEESDTLPFTYLSQIIKEQPFFEKRAFRIKGYISTLVSQTVITDQRLTWKVIVKVNDGSASIDAVLGEESTMLEAKRARDTVKCQAIQQQTVQFQKKLSQTSCLMDVQFSPSEPNPLVIRLTEPSREDILGLISRLS